MSSSSSRKNRSGGSSSNRTPTRARTSASGEDGASDDVAGGGRSSSRSGSRLRDRERRRDDRPERSSSKSSMRRVGSNSSLGSVGSSASGRRKKEKGEKRGGKRESRAAAIAAPSESADQPSSHQRPPTSFSSRTRENRERESRERRSNLGLGGGGSAGGDDASTYSARSGSSGTGGGLSHEDEIERIRELRARRLRNERLERSGGGSDNASIISNESRREREKRRAVDNKSAGRPERTRSTPLVSRQELEEAGLVRRNEQRPRTPSLIERSSGTTRSMDSMPVNDQISTSYSRSRRNRDSRDTINGGDDEDSTRYLSRRDRMERPLTSQDETLSSYRARRERELGISTSSQDSVDSYRSRRERNSSNDDVDSIRSSRLADRLAAANNKNDDGESPINTSRLSDHRRAGLRSRENLEDLRSRRARSGGVPGEGATTTTITTQQDEDASATIISDSQRSRDRHLPGRSYSGADDALTNNSISSRGERDRRRLPPRSRSADLDVMAQNSNKSADGESSSGIESQRSSAATSTRSRLAELSASERRSRLAAATDRDRSGNDDSNDLTTRLRRRREERMAERQQAGIETTGDATTMSSARRRIMRQRSNENTIQTMAASNTENTATSSTTSSSAEKPLSGAAAALDGVNNPAIPATKPKKEVVPEKKRKTFLPPDDNHQPADRVPELEFSSDDDETGEALQNWSIRVNVVSAVDLPLNVVPNMPLCPVLKIGLVKIQQSDIARPSSVIEKLASRSIESINSARVRSTTSKILSKRDNGGVDFHQQMRWDSVKHPMQAAICIELCAKAVKTPENYVESPQLNLQDEAFKGKDPTTTNAHEAAAATTAMASPGVNKDDSGEPTRGVTRSASGQEGGGLRGLWRRATDRKAAELEAAEAAAAVARMLVEEDPSKKASSEGKDVGTTTAVSKTLKVPQADYDVTLHSSTGTNKRRRVDMTEDQRLGTLVVPLTSLPLEKATNGNEAAIVEQWFQIEEIDESLTQSGGGAKKPSVLLEICFSSPEILDSTEDELEAMDIDDADDSSFNNSKSLGMMQNSFSRTESVRQVFSAGEKLGEKKPDAKVEDPILESGVIDFISVVGCRDIGKIKNDDGTKGWVDSSPDPSILEQFPPSDEFHHKNGRIVGLPGGCEWFCFPEGTKLWRGTSPPSLGDLNLKRFSAASPPNVASSIAAFDACLGCTTSFSWFVLVPPNSNDGSKLVKIYVAVIRFFVPAPVGIDPTQEDFAQKIVGEHRVSSTKGGGKRLWVPMAICFTSSLPVVGVMEAMLLRLCEELVGKAGSDGQLNPAKLEDIHSTLANVVVNFQKPIAGAVNCSVPFLGGDRFLLSLPPPTGLPALPHGRAVVSVCRLLGAEGIIFLLSAILTECKILFHSQDLADLAMVADVATTLAYPFTWSHAFVPILPLGLGMLEVIEAPFPYILGIPTSSLKLVDPNALDDVVVIDLDNGFASDDYYDGRRLTKAKSKSPHPLPTTVASNIAKAVYRLLRAEEEVESEFGETNFGAFNLPGLEQESLAEREFRIILAIEVSGLLRGYQECVGTVFNRDKFLKISPALFEERRDRGVGSALSSRGSSSGSKVISPRSKRFLALLVNSQNFHQFIESLENDEAVFFHEIMETFEDDTKNSGTRVTVENGLKSEKILSQLSKNLQKVEDKIPTYRVDQKGGLGSEDGFGDDEFFFGNGDDDFHDFDDFGFEPDTSNTSNTGDDMIANSFTNGLLAPVDISSQPTDNPNAVIEKLQSNPWDYQRIFDIPAVDESIPDPMYTVQENVKLRDAIGERRYRAWKLAQDQKAGGAEVDMTYMPDNSLRASKTGTSIDLNSLISSATQDTESSSISSSSLSSLRQSNLTPEQQRVADAKHRDVIRRCMDKARVGKSQRMYSDDDDDTENPFVENGRDLIAESEKALRNPSAQRFLLSILSQRSRLENQRLRTNRRQSIAKATASRLEPIAFDCLVRLSCAMLDSCMEFKEYEPAYRLLTQTAGFIMVLEDDDVDEIETEGAASHVVTMTSRLGLHPIFAYIEMWETVMSLHHQDRQSERKSDTRSSDEETEEEEEEEDNDELQYEAAVATLYEMVGYGIPGEELSRFAQRASEEHGWFCDDRGRQLLMLARRISIRRDQTDSAAAGEEGDIDMIRKQQDEIPVGSADSANSEEYPPHSWMEICWCHPAAPSAGKGLRSETIESDSSKAEYMKRSPVTSVACFGSKVVVTGGLDGSVFLAHSIAETMSVDGSSPAVRGIHLDWGSASRAGAGSSSDGEYGVGAVSCLAAAGGTSQQRSLSPNKSGREIDHSEIIASMEGSRVVAGTTAGDLRVWSIKDVYSAIMMAKEDAEAEPRGPGSGGNASTRLKFSLRGRALSGHRGGVTCIDVPSHVYRPDSLITGGADGLIKLWSLRAPTGGRRAGANANNEGEAGGQQQRGRGGDALSVLSGHGGRRVMCIKTAWHGDRLLSGGADRTIRIWDLSSGSGKCLHALAGHSGWVTKVDYWGPNTIISASTDRSLALWDARVRNSPLFMLRYHQAPVSDFMVGTRTDPLMISAGADGTVATWDFRTLSDSSSHENSSGSKDSTKRCQVVRGPAATMRHEVIDGTRKPATSAVYLSRVVENPTRTFLSTGSDAIIREWVASSGELVDEAYSGHCDAISSFQTYGRATNIGNVYAHEGTITTSWDGTVRMRKLIDNPS